MLIGDACRGEDALMEPAMRRVVDKLGHVDASIRGVDDKLSIILPSPDSPLGEVQGLALSHDGSALIRREDASHDIDRPLYVCLFRHADAPCR